MTSKKLTPYFLLTTIVIFIDQVSKLMIEATFQFGEFVPVTSFFNLGLTYNPGAAFSFLADHNGWQRWFFTALSLFASIFIVFYMRKNRHLPKLCIGLAFILGGAIGNLIDRVRIGKVVDFLDFYVGNSHWPAFNLADSAIFVGVVILLLDEFRQKKI
ncbi:signal peptidase II [Hydromonas duriensis]|uniref:Lipoprotein signal peptidase n=1 Tax=Hydromonas duriensis TaxID=1527608 RepID=A0A4V3DJP4_9BURK|nr:signal peptidase II [Hydromonas duriensis]TDR30512.1 signal peptidase II [Hydromonas duriensis]